MSTFNKLSFIILIIIFSCSNNKNELNRKDCNYPEYDLSNKKITKRAPLEFNSIYESIDGFQLEASGGMIGSIAKISIYKDYLLILDRHFAKKIFVYNAKSGKFLYTLGKKGKGPDEMLKFWDFDICKETGNIIVSDYARKRLLTFDIKGNYLYAKIMDFRARYIAKKGNYLYFKPSLIGNNNYSLIITDENLKIQSKYFHKKDYPMKNLSTGNSLFYKYKNKLLLNFWYCDTVYELVENNLNPYFIRNTGKYSYHKWIENKSQTELEIAQKNHQIFKVIPGGEDFYNYMVYYGYYFENDDYISYKFHYKSDILFFYAVKNDNNFCISYNPLSPRFNDKIILSHQLHKTYDNKYGTISWQHSHNMPSINKIKKYRQHMNISQRFMTELANIDHNGNPFIYFFK